MTHERPNYRTTDDLLSRYVVIFPGCAATAALKATLGKGATRCYRALDYWFE